MGMPVSIEIAGVQAAQKNFDTAFDYFVHIDETFSTYKPGSEISRINRGEISEAEYSAEMKTVFALAEETKQLTHGYFDIHTADGMIDPLGLVKGWAINNAAHMLDELGCKNFQVDAGGDIQTRGKNEEGNEWSVGIRNPFNRGEIIKVIYPRGAGVATSGTYIRGKHIYDPHSGEPVVTPVLSLTVVGPDVYEADRFATAAFAMGERGVEFIEQLDGFEGYAVDEKGVATMTSGFTKYTSQ